MLEMRRLLGLVILCWSFLGPVACSGTAPKPCGFDAGLCPQGQVCIEPQLVCAEVCGKDGGAICPPGTTCQPSNTYCGISCDGIEAAVCK